MAAGRSRDRATVERHLRVTLRHVAIGQRLVDKQHAVVTTLEAHGHATETARKLLGQFQWFQATRIGIRDRLVEELAQSAE